MTTTLDLFRQAEADMQALERSMEKLSENYEAERKRLLEEWKRAEAHRMELSEQLHAGHRLLSEDHDEIEITDGGLRRAFEPLRIKNARRGKT